MSASSVAVSTVDGLVVRPSGSWVRRKYFYLRRYADIFTTGMKRKWPRGGLTYIDLFAGPGRCLIEEEGVEVDGSPLLVLNYGFSQYIFVESDETNLSALKKRCQHSPKHSSIEFVHGDCNEVIHKVNPAGLSLAFIDPTGIDCCFETIRVLTQRRNVDLLVTVQFGMDIKRNFRGYLETGPGSKLDLFLGGNTEGEKLDNPLDAVALYKKRIKQLGYSTVEFKDMVVRNLKRNVPMYFLLFASRHPRGLEFWRKITSKDDTGQLELF